MRQILFLLALMMAPLSFGAQVSNLYSATVQIRDADNDSALLEQAFSQTVEQVLGRVSGQPSAISSSVLSEAQRQAASWVAQHSVESIAGGDAKRVHVTFYKESINNYLYQSNLPVWGANRPSVLVWMVEESDAGRVTYGSQRSSSTLSGFFDRAGALGLPVYAPLDDNSDRTKLPSSELWGFFQEEIRDASQRYDTDVIAVVRIGRYSGEYVFDSMLLYPEQSVRLSSVSDASKSEGMGQVAAMLASRLSERYAATRASGDPDAMQIRVDGIHSYQDIAKVTRYLSDLSIVRQVQLAKVVEDKVEFILSLDGTAAKFNNSVALNTVLRSKQVSALDPDANRLTVFEYRK
ncbi:DUF2066 domain-containing protein [Marinomonas ostreistagni]|uniref:DUF2066 domain-containing protein n=1 Tax=Marinomonas ostreistagni TaxID=359209 RepID=UPI0019508D28|nr:DUF2066 domain-containing protein [Marinomonas ostreistagni]MBM6550440.1 DUF2066 domain-containing protein [Marinomonas ostreistagni]